jgi:hypothetical protein
MWKTGLCLLDVLRTKIIKSWHWKVVYACGMRSIADADPGVQLNMDPDDSESGSKSEKDNFKLLMSARNRFQGIDSASLCSLAGHYDNHIPTRFLAPKVVLKFQHGSLFLYFVLSTPLTIKQMESSIKTKLPFIPSFQNKLTVITGFLCIESTISAEPPVTRQHSGKGKHKKLTPLVFTNL